MNNSFNEETVTRRSFIGNLLKQGLPLSLGTAAQLVISLVDVWFVGGIDRNSSDYLTGVSAVAPVLILGLALCFGLGNGLTAFISEHSNDEGSFREDGISTALLLGGVLMIPFLLAGMVFPLQTMHLLGVSGESAVQGSSYLLWVTPSIVVEMILYLKLGTLLADGKGARVGATMTAAALLNILFNAILIKVFGLGVVGAALGTTLANSAAFLFVLPKRVPLIKPEVFPQTAKPLVEYALPIWIGQGAGSIGLAMLNFRLGVFGNEAISAAMLAARLEQLILLPVIGFNGALLASAPGLLKNGNKHVRKVVIHSSIGVALVVTAVVMIPLIISAPGFFSLFTENGVVSQIAVEASRFALILLPLSAVAMLQGTVVQSERKVKPALLITFGRSVIPPLLAVAVSLLISSSLAGLWLGYGAGYGVSMIVASLVMRRSYEID